MTLKLHEMCLRDGMHPKRHQISIDQMTAIATAVDRAGVPLLEISHGDGCSSARQRQTVMPPEQPEPAGDHRHRPFQ